MPFFLPRRLIDLEYLGSDEPRSEYETKLYQDNKIDIEFAWFAVNLGYSKDDFEQLTQREIAFIKKAWENKVVLDTSMQFKAMMTSFANVYRKKGKGVKKLWEKSKGTMLAHEEVEAKKQELEIAKQIAKKDGNDWVKKIKGR